MMGLSGSGLPSREEAVADADRLTDRLNPVLLASLLLLFPRHAWSSTFSPGGISLLHLGNGGVSLGCMLVLSCTRSQRWVAGILGIPALGLLMFGRGGAVPGWAERALALAMSLATLEAMVGQLFLVVVVARSVALDVSQESGISRSG